MTMMTRASTSNTLLLISTQTFAHAVVLSPVKFISQQKWSQKHSWLGRHKYPMKLVTALLSYQTVRMTKILKFYCHSTEQPIKRDREVISHVVEQRVIWKERRSNSQGMSPATLASSSSYGQPKPLESSSCAQISKS